jgi:hypothetical protein
LKVPKPAAHFEQARSRIMAAIILLEQAAALIGKMPDERSKTAGESLGQSLAELRRIRDDL